MVGLGMSLQMGDHLSSCYITKDEFEYVDDDSTMFL